MVSRPPNIVFQHDWHITGQGESVLQCLYNPQTSRRRLFAVARPVGDVRIRNDLILVLLLISERHRLSVPITGGSRVCTRTGVLEKPAIPTVADEVSYKLLFIGKSGVGKSTIIAYLAGISEPLLHIHTHGIHKTNIYWPMKLKDKVVMFKLQCWEAGESGLKKYSHILPACKDKVDGVVFVFSFADSRSFNDVHQNFTKFVKNDTDNVTKIVIGTRYSSVPQCNEVKPNEIEEFEYLWNVSVQKIHDNAVVETNEAYKEVSVLNLICEQTFIRDQQFQLNRV